MRIWRQYFSAKLVIAFIVLISVPIAIISSLYYQSAASVIAQNERKSAKQTARQVTEMLESIMTVGSDLSQQILSDAKFQEAINRDMSGPISTDDRIRINGQVTNTLDNLMFHNSFIQSIYMIKDDDTQWGSGLFSSTKVYRHNARDKDWYAAAKEAGNRAIWRPIGYDLYNGINERTVLVLPLIKGLTNLSTLNNVGVLIVNLDGKLIVDKINQLSLGKTGHFFVVDADGQIVVHTDLQQVGTSIADQQWGSDIVQSTAREMELEWRDEERTHYVVTHRMSNDWTVIGTVPVVEIIGDINKIRTQTFMYGLAFALVAIMTALYISNRTTKPLKRLMQQMRRVGQGDLHVKVAVDSEDEIGQLSRRFNEMIGQTRRLVERVGEEETQKKEAEIRALRYQINPHFIYNTLSSIRWLVKYNRSEEAFKAMAILAQLLESIAGKRGPFITLRDEIDLLHKYMEIHRFRYDKPIHFRVKCPEDLLELQVPSMLLQPLIENAVFHGIAPLEGDGEIVLQAERMRGDLVITITDNGIGMTEEQLSEPFSGGQRSGLSSIGLRNIRDQLKLYYSHAELKIESTPGQGTTVMLIMNMLEKGIREHAGDANSAI